MLSVASAWRLTDVIVISDCSIIPPKRDVYAVILLRYKSVHHACIVRNRKKKRFAMV